MVSVAKVASIFVLLGATFILGITPIWLLKLMTRKMKNLSNIQYYVSLMNCFGGGVFLGTSILHLIQTSMTKVAKAIPEVTYPLSGVLIGAGFFIVLLIEHAIGLFSKEDDNPFLAHGHDHDGHGSHDISLEKTIVDEEDGTKAGTINPAVNTGTGNIYPALNTETGNIYPTLNTETGNIYPALNTETGNIYPAVNTESGNINPAVNTEETSGDEVRSVSFRALSESSVAVDLSVSQSNGGAEKALYDTKKKSTIVDLSGDGRSKTQKRIRAVILCIALSIHMIFAGMAIGLQDTESGTWTLAVAIAIHKIIVVFSVCLKMKEIVSNNKVIILYILYLSSISPIGIAIGLVISSTGSAGSAQDISSGVLQSLAAGTFIYVTFFEILQKELSQGYSLVKVFLTLLGFGAIAGLKVVT